MKLSMWMIANRLSSLLDIQTEIALDARPILNSARLVYATNCVHVYPENDYVVYYGEGDKIKVYNLTVKEAFEIVQGVFDYYQDWEGQIRDAIQKGDYQKLVEHCALVFQNPLLLMNANYRLLGMSLGYSDEEMDNEWNYIRKYGYSSLDSIRKMKLEYTVDFSHEGSQAFKFENISGMQYGGTSYNLVFNQNTCGRITLLSKNRPLNTGDYQLLQKLAEYLEPVLGLTPSGDSTGNNALINLLLGKPYTEHELKLHLDYNHWKADSVYQIIIFEPQLTDRPQRILSLLMRTIQHQFPDSVSLIHRNQVIVMINRDLSRDPQFLDLLPVIKGKTTMKCGFSLPSSDYTQAPRLLQQATHAILYGKQYAPNDWIYHFETYSLYYMLETPYIDDKLQACHPVVRTFWRAKIQQRDELYDTLQAYLDNERSLSRTAAALFTHRNTVLYRIKKCQEILHDDLEDPSVRYYIRLSMHVIETAGTIAVS